VFCLGKQTCSILKENWTLFIRRSRNHIIKPALNVGYQGGTECHGGITISKFWDKRQTEPSTRHTNPVLSKTGKHTARCADLLRNRYDRVKETLGETSALVWKARINLQEFIKFLDGPKPAAKECSAHLRDNGLPALKRFTNICWKHIFQV